MTDTQSPQTDEQVLQCDRDAAADYFKANHPDKLAARYIRNPAAAKFAGKEHPLAIAFAQHRLATAAHQPTHNDRIGAKSRLSVIARGGTINEAYHPSTFSNPASAFWADVESARQPDAMADQSTEARLSAAEIETYARLMARNLDAGDSRMLRENIVCLLFRSRHGRDPSWEELEPAFAALAALRSRTGDQSND